MTEKIGLIGLGIMGKPMGKNLLQAGFPLTVWNRTASRMDELVALGAKGAASPQEVAEQSDIIITMVSDSPDVQAVVLGDGGVIHGVRAGSVVVDMSTISPQVTREIAAALKEKNVAMLDAPVSGGEKGAIEGTLSIMVGGDAAVLERVRPVFDAMGKRIVHIGGNSMGQVCKLANQIAVVLNNLAMSEALVFAAKSGADVSKVLEAIQAGAAGSWALTNYAPKILRRDFSPGFMVSLQQKDLNLVMEASREMNLALPGTALTYELQKALQAWDLEGEGNFALVKVIESMAGVQVAA
ncbi:MAG: 2-hydroxy-3-oxopropionate reductase [Chloroflexota bacterium]|nr:MAG: 2-hydroxy-3-oxopropionate reductase [Chloroflexota bacterium]